MDRGRPNFGRTGICTGAPARTDGRPTAATSPNLISHPDVTAISTIRTARIPGGRGGSGGRLARRVARGVFLTAVTLFTVASAAPSRRRCSNWLIFRIVQGLGGGAMTPVGGDAVPNVSAVRAGPVEQDHQHPHCAGPRDSGRCSAASWSSWIFWINLPIGIVRGDLHGAGGGWPGAPTPGSTFPDSCSFASSMFALSEGARAAGRPRRSPLGVGLLTLLVVVEVGFPRRCCGCSCSDCGSSGQRNLITFASAAGFLGGLFVYPLMLQTAFEHAADRGLADLPGRRSGSWWGPRSPVRPPPGRPAPAGRGRPVPAGGRCWSPCRS